MIALREITRSGREGGRERKREGNGEGKKKGQFNSNDKRSMIFSNPDSLFLKKKKGFNLLF